MWLVRVRGPPLTSSWWRFAVLWTNLVLLCCLGNTVITLPAALGSFLREASVLFYMFEGGNARCSMESLNYRWKMLQSLTMLLQQQISHPWSSQLWQKAEVYSDECILKIDCVTVPLQAVVEQYVWSCCFLQQMRSNTICRRLDQTQSSPILIPSPISEYIMENESKACVKKWDWSFG